MGSLAAHVVWEREREKPSVDRLSQLISAVRCTRHSLVANCRLRAIPRQALVLLVSLFVFV